MFSNSSRKGQLTWFVAAVVAALGGCGGGNGNPGPGQGQGYATFHWGIYDIENGAAVTCTEAGASYAYLTLTNAATNQVYPQSAVSCQDYVMTTTYVPAGNYYLDFDLAADPTIYGAGTDYYVDSQRDPYAWPIQAGGTDFAQSTDVLPFTVQSFDVAWDVYSQAVPTTCAAVGGSYVDFQFAVGNSASWITTRFDCGAKGGLSVPVPVGFPTAQWQITLYAANGVVLDTIPGGTVSIPTTAQNVHLPLVNFSL